MLIKFTFSFKTVPEGCICNLSELMKLLMFFSEVPSDERLKEIIDYVHSLGGLVTVNHIPWSNRTEWGYQVGTLPDHPSREKLLEMVPCSIN